MLLSAAIYDYEEWFLAGPMLIVALCGLFYHIGVNLSGVSLKLQPSDSTDFHTSLKTSKNVPPFGMFFSTLIVLVLCVVTEQRLGGHSAEGLWWAFVLFGSIYYLPCLMLGQQTTMGLILLMIVLPVSVLMVRSKAILLFALLPIILFFQQRILKVSRLFAILLICAILLTPYAVARYSESDEFTVPTFETRNEVSWSLALEQILHREYAFLCFAIAYQYRAEGDSFTWGHEILGELGEMVPRALWPGKPLRRDIFPSQYLSADWSVLTASYTKHFLTPFLLDFGIPGCCAGMLLIGLLYGFFYKLARDASVRRNEAWPLMLYLPLVIASRPLVSDGLALGIVAALGNTAGLVLCLGLSKLFARKMINDTASAEDRTSTGEVVLRDPEYFQKP